MSDSVAELIWVVNAARIVQMNYIVATALIGYDYLLTFGREVRHIWKRRFNSSSLLFYGVRYPAIASTIFVFLDLVPWKGMSDQVCFLTYSQSHSLRLTPAITGSCTALIRTQMALDIILLVASSVFSGLRAYALSDHSRLLLVSVITLGLINPIITIYTFLETLPLMITAPFQVCGFNTAISPVMYENWSIIARAASVIADAIVIGVTWKRTWAARVEAAHINFRPTLTSILMRDGTMYFVVLVFINAIGMVVSRQLELIQPMSTWIGVFTSILTGRFILDLHEASEALAGDQTALTRFYAGNISFEQSMAFRTMPRSTSGRTSLYGTVLPLDLDLGPDFYEEVWDDCELLTMENRSPRPGQGEVSDAELGSAIEERQQLATATTPRSPVSGPSGR